MIFATYETLAHALMGRAQRNPDGRAIVFLYENSAPEEVTNAQWYAGAVSFARALQAAGVQSGDLVILVLPHGRELVSAFMGAMFLAAIPSIFAYLTPRADLEIYMRRVQQLVTLARARAVITVPGLEEDLQTLLTDSGCLVLSSAEVPAGVTSQPSIREFWDEAPGTRPPRGEDIAYLQFTSGTTGLPKGVLLSHRAVLTHLRAAAEWLAFTDKDINVSWLPLYHDMGLNSGLLIPLLCSSQIVLMSPFHWIRSPVILFQAIDRYRGTCTWMPNFGLNHCVLSIRERDMEGLDLSSWRMLGNGSEPVHYESLQGFTRHFAPYGFCKEAHLIGYGLAENVVAAALTPIDREPDVDWVSVRELQETGRAVPTSPKAAGARPVVSCGYPVAGTDLHIVDDQGKHLPDRQVGQVILCGDSMAQSYYLRPDLTAQAFRDGWLYTGDMGYMVEGQVYLCGRSKDLVIVGGKNIYPHDVEGIANSVPGVYPGRVAAFGVPDERLGTEGLVLVCELQPDVNEQGQYTITRELRRRVVQEMDVTLFDLRFVEKGWVIKTSDGKIARSANRQKYFASFAAQEPPNS